MVKIFWHITLILVCLFFFHPGAMLMIKQVLCGLCWVNMTSMWLEANEMSACAQQYSVFSDTQLS